MPHIIFGKLWGGFTILQLFSPDIVRNGLNQFKKIIGIFFTHNHLAIFQIHLKVHTNKSSNLDEFAKNTRKM